MRMLIVGSNQRFNQTLGQAARCCEVEVTCCERWQEAYEQVQASHFDLMAVDIQMLEMNEKALPQMLATNSG